MNSYWINWGLFSNLFLCLPPPASPYPSPSLPLLLSLSLCFYSKVNKVYLTVWLAAEACSLISLASAVHRWAPKEKPAMSILPLNEASLKMTHSWCYSMCLWFISVFLCAYFLIMRHANFSSSFCPSYVCPMALICFFLLTLQDSVSRPSVFVFLSSNKPAPRMDFAMRCKKLCGCSVEKMIPLGISFPPAVPTCVYSKTNRGVKIVAVYQLNGFLVFSSLLMSQKECVVLTRAVTDSGYKDDPTCPCWRESRKPDTVEGIPALRGRVCPAWVHRSDKTAVVMQQKMTPVAGT